MNILISGRPLEEAFDSAIGRQPRGTLEPRDRAFAVLVVMTALRRRGEFEMVLNHFLARPLPAKSGRLKPILLACVTQLLALDTPAHAAISLAVDQCRADQDARHFAGLANAVLRRVSTEGKALLATGDPAALNIPKWMSGRWQKQYGTATAQRIAAASLTEAPLDISLKGAAKDGPAFIGGVLLPTGSIRLAEFGRIEELPGYQDGAWWVQDAAAALPAKLFGDLAGKEAADLCAAPGGKTAQLAAAGARVTAVELSEVRIKRLSDNLRRLGLSADIVTADAAHWSPGRQFDAVLLDAPCSATGTIRRHPDILHTKRESDIAAFAKLQAQMLKSAAHLVKPGGQLVYCTCSLEAEEGEDQIERFLAENSPFERVPIKAGEQAIVADWISPCGDMRTLPCHTPAPQLPDAGMDGFFASRLRRKN